MTAADEPGPGSSTPAGSGAGGVSGRNVSGGNASGGDASGGGAAGAGVPPGSARPGGAVPGGTIPGGLDTTGTRPTVTLRIRRYDPERDAEPHWEDYEVPYDSSDRLLDAIMYVKWHLDGSLAFRRSCAHGVCGSDAMRVNGVNRLACKVLVRDLGPRILVEPLKGLPVEKDLIVDMEPFFASYRAVLPYLITEGAEPTRERLQSPAERERFDDTTKCILCAACTASCPVFWTDGDYVGPASIVNAHRFIFDSRDEGAAERLEILNDAEGVWRCRTIFNCTNACPRGIQVTKAIQEVKRALLFRRG